jgi:diazepam-binding inhibitor (GABA receptor modulating acyl-CoA-binding protein)
MLDLKGVAKWDAWNQKKGQSKESAMEEYIALAKTIQSKCA